MQEVKGTTEDEMVGWHHRLSGHESEQAPIVVMEREAWCAAVHRGAVHTCNPKYGEKFVSN